jgi:hypothetical protein
MQKDYTKEFYIDNTVVDYPVVRWLSNDRVPFKDMLDKFFDAGLIDQQIVLNSIQTHNAEQRDSIQEYIKYRQNNGYSDQEKREMKAAFGGETIVDVFTGKIVNF